MSAVFNTAVTNVQHQNLDKVFQNVCNLAEGFHKQSVRLVAGITQFMLVSQFPQDDGQRKKLDDVKTFLHKQLNERGLKQAMIYRYIATAQKLAQLFTKPGISSPFMVGFFTAKHEEAAFKHILKGIEDHAYVAAGSKPMLEWNRDAEQKIRFSIDVLRVNLGLDNLEAAPKANDPTASSPRAGNNTGNGSSNTSSAKAVEATKASAASIVKRIQNDVKAVAELPVESVVGIVDTVVGRYEMAKRLIGLMTMDEVIKLQADVNNRIAELAHIDATAEQAVDNAVAGKTRRSRRRNTADVLPEVSPTEQASETTTTEDLSATG